MHGASDVAQVVSTAVALVKDDSVREKLRLATVNSFGEEEWPAMERLLGKESGLDPYVVNQSSHACGLFQSLPCSKVGGTVYFDTGLNKYRLDPNSFTVESHIQWGINYIKNRYGSPSNALNFHHHNNWY